MSLSLRNRFHSCEVNWLPLSEIITSEQPWTESTYSSTKSISASVVIGRSQDTSVDSAC